MLTEQMPSPVQRNPARSSFENATLLRLWMSITKSAFGAGGLSYGDPNHARSAAPALARRVVGA
jgi:hypothetical protein